MTKAAAMRCADARRDLSSLLDDELDRTARTAVEAHVDGCGDCRTYRDGLHRVRVRLRVEPVERVVDLAPALRAAIATAPAPRRIRFVRPLRRVPQRARVVTVAAAFVAAFVAGATFAGFLAGPAPVSARDLSTAVLRAQRSVETMRAQITVVEHNWHPAVSTRQFEGAVVFRSPESLAVHLTDVTRYPSDAWVRNDVDVVVDGRFSWERGVGACPRETLPGCTPPARARGVTGREPFPERAPAPLDLVVPVRSFVPGATVESLGTRDIGGRRALGVRVTVAQIRPLLDGLLAVGNWRPLHPTDEVDLWLDDDALVPLALDIRAADTDERREWAARRGLERGGPILSMRIDGLELDSPVDASAFPAPPPDATLADAGFADTDALHASTTPSVLPAGMRRQRTGVVHAGAGPAIDVAAWSDGRAWLKVSSTTQWNGGHLFGDLGAVVHEIAVGKGVGYTDERGDRIAIHGEGVDVVVEGTLARADLVRVAASLPTVGRTVPGDWDEASTTTIAELRETRPWLLVPDDSGGDAQPAGRVDGDTVTLVYAGPGARDFQLVEAPGARLGPPFDVDARAVEVRGHAGRWSPSLGALEWVEDGIVVSITSRSIGLDELVAIAEALQRP
jgi:hypothetical protein